MGGGRPILTFIFTAAGVGTGRTITNAKRIVPKSNFFIVLPPLPTISIASGMAGFIIFVGLRKAERYQNR